MNSTPLSIPDVLQIKMRLFEDQRGFFMETYQADDFAAAGIRAVIVQENHSRSHRGVLRGLHYQVRHSQGKLLRVVTGETFNVAVDLRRSSPTFGRWTAIRLSAKNQLQLWIPPGFAHGFLALSEPADLVYAVTDRYAPQWERTILWNDPDLKIDWPLAAGTSPVLSEKDALGKPFREAEVYESF
ncbi:MAG: dTDP-4-dehydrorhamnose 3,5-epimerase [Anaerolineales bacterium]|nr:dTDP-4-dehydrorhamnose 3,5-epimerase [Anaerolineales bacterium]